ncbi:MAG: hypothetical protein GWN07_06540 [Actinobacteria bacterium]|nr:hypothetical protein [Actinomycetota bacterium]NIW26955.1 hypothetical protein [Actinomycetota bacterium]NIX19505.1 hypothetical protein [Actinomycetota bacterium]
MGLYKVRLEESGERTRRFKILLFAESPDRLHGEILSPVGSTVMIFDSGAGRLAVTFVRDREAYVGTADPAAMEAVFGLRMTLGQLVGGLLTGEGGTDELRMVREASVDGLPDRLELSSGPRTLTLDLRRRLALRERPGGVGTGRPPEGMTERPLDELRLHPLPEEIEQTPTG